MNQWQRDVQEFHDGVVRGKRRPCADPGFRDTALRLSLVEEETRELREAVETGNFPEAVDALVDILYVTLGAAVAWGVDLDLVWRAVHAANMAKGNGPMREDGKRLKPHGWKAPDVAGVIDRQRDSYRIGDP
jgi:hypothetical protein